MACKGVPGFGLRLSGMRKNQSSPVLTYRLIFWNMYIGAEHLLTYLQDATKVTYRQDCDILSSGGHSFVPSQRSIVRSSVRDQYKVVRSKRTVSVRRHKHRITHNPVNVLQKVFS